MADSQAADGAAPPDGVAPPPWAGHLRLQASAEAGRTRLSAQSFRAPYHLSKPYWDAPAGTLLVQVVNPTAGILAGDRLQSTVEVMPGAALLLTTPSASRVFRMRAGEARSEQRFRVASGAWLEVWPEPLVPHAEAVFTQRTRIDIDRGGGLWYGDALLPGRVAHGEAWAWRRLVLEFSLHRQSVLVLRERFDQTGAQLAALAGLAGAGAGAALGNFIWVLPEPIADAPWREALHALQGEGVWVGASPLRDPAAWSIKVVAPDGDRLRQTLRAIRRCLSQWAPALAADPRKL